MKYNDNGVAKDIYVKASDTLPVGSIVEIPDNMSIPDGWEEVEDDSNTYSTEEQVIGKWINGKPLYQKSITLDKSQLVSGNHDYLHNISNIDIITSVEGLVLRASGTTDSIPWQSSNESWRTCINDRTRSYIGLYLGETLIANCTSIVLTLEYTKTTD